MFVAGIAENNELAQDYRDHLKKYVPALRSYGLNDAAQYYEDWWKVCWNWRRFWMSQRASVLNELQIR